MPGKTIHVPFYHAVVAQNDGKDEFYDAHVTLDHGRVAWQTARSPFYLAVIDQNDGKGVFYSFACKIEKKERVIQTSAWTLLQNLKTHMPLAGKTLLITKKNVSGKQKYYVSKPNKE